MEYRPLNITVISADGLKDVKLFSKMDVYAEVSIAGYPQSKKRTFVDKNCGTDPKWNHRMEFIVDEPYLTKPGLSLLFQLKAERSFGSDKEIGSVTVPVHELFKPDSEAEDRVVEYQLHTTSGKPKGSLKFSFRFGEKFTQQVEAKHRADEPVTAYPAAAPYASGSGYAAGPHPGVGYPPPPPPPHAVYGAYPQTSGYGYQPPPPGYGYPPAGYPQYAQAQKPKKNKMGMGGGLGLGLGAGLLGGLLVGEMASDIGESAAYADGYGDAMGDMGGGFDF
ncbi:hypothetical protein Pfo_002018 [Paulownia fortunei]|nr:hypothetical protein Pfo_002018 [Paulownia fortunei]